MRCTETTQLNWVKDIPIHLEWDWQRQPNITLLLWQDAECDQKCRIVTCSSAWLRVTEYTLNIAKLKTIQYTPTSTMYIYMAPPNKRKKTRSWQWGSSNDITNWSILSTVQERCKYRHNMHLQCFGVQVCAQVKTKKEAIFWNQHLVLKRLTPMIKIVNPLHENACDPSKSSTRSKQDKSPCAGLVGPNSQRTLKLKFC